MLPAALAMRALARLGPRPPKAAFPGDGRAPAIFPGTLAPGAAWGPKRRAPEAGAPSAGFGRGFRSRPCGLLSFRSRGLPGCTFSWWRHGCLMPRHEDRGRSPSEKPPSVACAGDNFAVDSNSVGARCRQLGGDTLSTSPRSRGRVEHTPVLPVVAVRKYFSCSAAHVMPLGATAVLPTVR